MKTNVLLPLSLHFYCDKLKLNSLKYLNIPLVKGRGREGIELIIFQEIGLLIAALCLTHRLCQETKLGWFCQNTIR